MKNRTNSATWMAPAAILFAGLAATPLAVAQEDAGAGLIRSAVEALGGQARVEAAGSFVIEGQGSSWAPVGGVSPQAEQDLTNVTDLRERIHLAHGRMRVTATRTLQFPLALATVQKQDQGLNGDITYNIGGGTAPLRLDPAAMRQRRMEMLSHPLTLVRAALDPKSRLERIRQNDGGLAHRAAGVA